MGPIKLSEAQRVVLQGYLNQKEEKLKMDVFKQMKKVLDLSFGKECNQIIKLDVDQLASFFEEQTHQGYIASSGRFTINMLNEVLGGAALILLIWFPEIKITNSRRSARIIRDLYVRIPFSSEGKMVGQLEGIRSTLSKEEWTAGYIHSHLPAHGLSSPYHFTDFCLGTGEINQVMSILRLGYNEIDFTLFCLHLKNYVKWESLEGHPYIKMSNINIRNSGSRLRDVIPVTLKIIVDRIYNELLKFPTPQIREFFTYALSDKGMTISPTNEVEEWIGDTIRKQCPISELNYAPIENFLAYKDSLDAYYPVNISTSSPHSVPTYPILKFKGEDKELVINDLPHQIKTEKQYAHPSITRELCSRISSEITKTAIRFGGNVRSGDTINSIGEAPNPDLLPVQQNK